MVFDVQIPISNVIVGQQMKKYDCASISITAVFPSTTRSWAESISY